MASDRLRALEARLQSIEKVNDEPFEQGCCEFTGSLIYDIFRSIPYMTILAIAPTLIGAACILKTWKSVESVLAFVVPAESYDAAISHQVAAQIPVVMGAIVVVDILAILTAFPATGATREALFGQRASTALWICMRCLVGQLLMFLVMILLIVTFAVAFILIFFAVPSATFLDFAAGACTAGADTTASIVKAFSATKLITAETVSHGFATLCASKGTAAVEAMKLMKFAFGVALVAVGQAWQLTMHSDAYETEQMQADIEAREELTMKN